MEGVKRQKSISKIFAMYIIIFCIVAAIIVVFDSILFLVAADSGLILPANYYEQQIEKHRDDIASVEDISAIIPKECEYAVYNLEGKKLQGTFSEDKSLNVWKFVQNGEKINGRRYYKIIQRKGEVCVVEYTLVSNFANPILRKYVPSADLGVVIIFVILFITEIIIFSKCFRKRMLKEMQILKDTTINIQMENLDFEMKYSNIIEINEVLSALDKMKTELYESLNKQWKMEEMRKEQIAALAHDIKTPLTIIKGNSELLNELDLKQDQAEFNKRILNEVSNMESYIKSLIEIMKSEKEPAIEKKKIDLKTFVKEITEQGISMSINKRLRFLCETKNLPEFALIDEVELKRAINNIISNAIDYSKANGDIIFSVDFKDKYIRFIIEDSGRGFTKEGLSSATEQFFQGDKSRSSKNHYGMGLYIAKKFIERHNGRIYLSNSEKLGGAKVTLELPSTLS
ncbi:two-component sensor histidine kinase [Clostridium gelidum]|uniref:histidine kinase n=1 Tax=Clostridium gelidum TaxID=704125 RepID=A0ABM7T9X3_9CLOT|nr:HAMP domain-containing sensor histidine kinase [Clostridium gelidum]BCZ48761.1 two-component sensor histidine kinase [Clostridium gelidum]